MTKIASRGGGPALISKLLILVNSNNLRTIRKLIAYENFQDYSSALSVPSFFQRLVLDLVLKTSNSARLVLLNNLTNTMPNDDDGQDHMFRFILLKKVDRSATFGEVATPNVLHDVTIRQQINKSVHALFAQLASPVPKCHRDLQS